MKRIGQIVFSLLIALSAVGIVALLLDFAAAAEIWHPVALVAILAGPPVAFGGGWLAILWGANSSDQMLKIGASLIAHSVTAVLAGFSTFAPVLVVALVATIATDVVALRAMEPAEPDPA